MNDQFTESIPSEENSEVESIESETTNTKTEIKAEDTKSVDKISDKKDKLSDTKEVSDGVDVASSSPKTKEVETEEFSYQPIVKHLADKGILSIEESDLEGIDGSDDSFEKVIDKTVISRVEKVIEDYKNSLPEELHKLVEFVELGGNPKQFLDVYYGETSFEKLDLNSEENQKAVITQSLKLAGYSEEEVEEELKDYEDLGKMEIKAKVHLNKLKAIETEKKQSVLKQQEQEAIKQQQANKQYWDGLKTELFSKSELMGFKLTEKEKQEMWETMAQPDKKSGKTKLQLHNESNKDAQFLYTYLVTKNWDIDKLKKSVKTEVTSDLKKNLGRFTDNRQKISSGKTVRDKSDSENPFEGFQKLKL